MALSAEENELLTRVRPGNGRGEMLRRVTKQVLKDRPKRRRLLVDDLFCLATKTTDVPVLWEVVLLSLVDAMTQACVEGAVLSADSPGISKTRPSTSKSHP